MKNLLILVFLMPILSFGQTIPKWNTPDSSGWGTNKTHVDSINGKPIEYYLKHPDIDYFSKEFYKGNFKVYDNDESFGIMDSILTDNNDTRPFYLYNYCRMQEISDGALSEVIAYKTVDFIERHPCVLFELLSTKDYNADKGSWLGDIEFGIQNKTQHKQLTRKIEDTIKSKCDMYLQDWIIFKAGIYNNEWNN